MAEEDSLPIQVGRLAGRLDGLDTRFNRFEDFVGDSLRDIRDAQKENAKVISEKLDRIETRQTQSSSIWNLGRWLLGLAATGSGWFAFLGTKGH